MLCLGVWGGESVGGGVRVCFVKLFKIVKHKIRPNIIATLRLSLSHYISTGKTTDNFRLRKSYRPPKHDVGFTEKCRVFECRSRTCAVKA